MELTAPKKQILEAFLKHEKPVRPKQIAEEAGIKFPSVMMHIIGLSNVDYLTSPEKGYYILTQKGKKIISLPEITKDNAKNILRNNMWVKGFHFYLDIGKPLDLHALNLREFLDAVPKINNDSIRFHFNRGDFELWFKSLGDEELSEKVANLKNKEIGEDEKRSKLIQFVKERIEELSDFLEH